MREVVPGALWIGNARDARDPRELHEAGVAAVVDLAREEPPANLGREFVLVRVPLVDGPDNDPALLSLAVETVAAIHARGLPLLVACSAGLSRSPSIVAAALARVRGTSPETELTGLGERIPLDVSPALWRVVAGT